MCRIPKFSEQGLAIFPRQPKCTDIGYAKPGDDVPDIFGAFICEIAVLDRVFRPIHQIFKRKLVMQIGDEFIGNQFPGDIHGFSIFRIFSRFVRGYPFVVLLLTYFTIQTVFM